MAWGTKDVTRLDDVAYEDPEVNAPRVEPSPPAGPPHFAYSAALDGIRGVAMLAIIAYHDNYDWARGAFLSVDTFFVLSGFLITTLLVLEFRRNGMIRLPLFWARRARRLLPALLIVLGFVALYNHLVVTPWQREGVRGDMVASLFYVANWRFIIDKLGYFELFSESSPLRHMWSLAIEEQYYLIWPPVVIVCIMLGKGRLRVLAALSAIGIVASTMAMWTRFRPGDVSTAYYATDSRAHTFLFGGLLAMLLLTWTPRGRSARAIALVSILAMALMLLAWHQIGGTDSRYYLGGSPMYSLLVTVVIAGALQPGLLSRLLSIEPFPWIGRLSYGLYLFHWPITVWIVPARVGLGPGATNLLRLVLTFGAASLSFYLVEKPIRQRKWRPLATLGVFAPAIGVITALVIISAAGSAPPPSYIWALGDPLVCGTPRPAETKEAVQANARSGELPLPESVHRERILLLGDSSACSLWPGLAAIGDAQGIKVDQGSVFGCGIASDQITSTRNEAITPHSERCHDLVDVTERKALARTVPTTVIWMSAWEKSDLVVDGKTLVAGTPAGEAEIMSRMDAALARVTAGGARVVMVTVAAPAPNPAQGTETTDRKADDAGYVRLSALLQRFEARHRDKVTLVDLAHKVCPAGPPCPERVEGLHARPDGRHFTPTAATWAARWLLTQIYQRNP